MSYRPARGRLRERTPGVDRSQAALKTGANRPREGDWSDLWLDVIVRRLATSDRSVVTAAKYVYFTWQFNPRPGERHGEALYRNRLTSGPVHLLYTAGKRQKLSQPMAVKRPAELCEEVAARGPSRCGDHREHTPVLGRGGAAGRARGGGRYQSVSRNQPVSEEDRLQRCAPARFVSEQGSAAGGAYEG